MPEGHVRIGKGGVAQFAMTCSGGVTMSTTEYTIKTMSRQEVPIAIGWAAEEGWNPGLHDADCYYAADPQGFLIGYLGTEPIATISAIQYGASFGFLGFYIVKRSYRGRGYGIQLWHAALAHLRGRNIGLDGVVAQQENYKKSGFVLAYRNIRYAGKGGGSIPETAHIVPLSELSVDTVMTYDRPFFPDDRSRFIDVWIRQPDCYALGIMDHDVLAGYGVLRRCHSGYKIGPLFANTPQLADTLLMACKFQVTASEDVFLDVPEVNQEAVQLAEQHGMGMVFETARMYTEEMPAIPVDRVFGVTSFEVG